MSGQRGPRDSANAEQHSAAGKQKGGFGAFAKKYRDRWAADHPNAGTTNPAGDRPEPSTGADASDPGVGRAGSS